jgi:hypothetical protein
MLNEPLYEALRHSYVSVDIYNEGESLTLKRLPVPDSFRGTSGTHITSDMIEEGGEYYAVDCPFCNDTRHRLWVCHAWGSSIELESRRYTISKGVVHCYNEHCLEKHENWLEFCKTVEGSWRPGLVAAGQDFERLSKDKKIVIDMPYGNYYVTEPNGDKQVRAYLEGRRYNLNELAGYWNFRTGSIDFYDVPCVIMPVIYKGEYTFWQARYPCSGAIPEFFRDGRRKPKYYIPAGAKKSRVLYNFDNACMTPTIVLVEGIFDAVRVGSSGVAMFGKKPSTRQQQILVNEARSKAIVWIPDRDDPEAIEYARNYTNTWNANKLFAGGAYVLTLNDGDPADHTREELCSLIAQSMAR